MATTVKEATQLIEKGFEYVAEKDGTMMFRNANNPSPLFLYQSTVLTTKREYARVVSDEES